MFAESLAKFALNISKLLPAIGTIIGLGIVYYVFKKFVIDNEQLNGLLGGKK